MRKAREEAVAERHAEPPTVLLPLDGRRDAKAALPVARTLAEISGATVHLLHVGDRVVNGRQRMGDLGLDPDEVAGMVLDQAVGEPAEEILREAYEHDSRAIVLCSHTRPEQPEGALGHVAERVLCESTLPVVLVHPERGLRPWSLDRVLLPHDGTPTTAAAIGPAVEVARRAGVELVVLHVAAPGRQPSEEPGTLTVPRYIDQPQHEWPSWAQEFVQRLEALGHAPAAVRLRLVLAAGEPGPEIVRWADSLGADLIILAWHGCFDGGHALTLKHALREAPCPVVVVRAPEPSE